MVSFESTLSCVIRVDAIEFLIDLINRGEPWTVVDS